VPGTKVRILSACTRICSSLCIAVSNGSSFLATHCGNGYALRACHQMMMMSCEEQIRVQALNLLRLLWIVQSTVCPCLFTEICTCCFLFAVIQTLHLIVIVLIFNRGPSGHLHYITCRSYPSKTGKYMPFKKIAKQHAGNKAIALCFPIWLVVL